MPATPQDRLYGLTTSVAVKPPVYISADYEITRFGEQTITSKTPTDERTITTTEGMRVLLLGQDNPVENGIWVARRSFWVRATDFNGPRDAVNGTLVFSINGDCWQVEADDPVVIGKSAIHFRPTYPFEANLDILQRTLRVPEASVNVLPSAGERAWKGLGFDGAGQPKLQDPAGTGLWGYVPAIGSFEKGSLLTQRFEVLLWESTDEYWRWDGAMPKIVLPGSTPDTAGGRGKGKWLDVTDATLRSNLGSNEDDLGASLVGLAHVGTVQDALHNVINVEAFKSFNISDGDWGPAFRAAIAYAESIGGGVVQFTGNYTITSTDSVGWVLPFDDGTIDPARISAGTDSTLPSETEVTMPVHLNIPSGVSLVGDGVSTSSITFTWDWSSRPININQPIGICIRVINWDGSYIAASGAKNRMMTAIANTNVGGFTVKNCFIPIVGDGTLVYGEWPEISFNQCAFSVIALGSEMTKFSGFYGSNTLSGPIIGGWWLQRNELEYQGGVKVPPYVTGTDVYSLGWCDSIVIKVLKYDFPYWSTSEYSDSYKALDKFFDDYFWKTKNSMRAGETTPSGEPGVGRLSSRGSNYTSPSTLQAKNPFRGVATRALSIIPRYNRGNSANRVMELKTRGMSRPPILVGPSSPSGNVVSIDNAFVERSCLADMGNTSSRKVGGTNDWFTVGGDIWNADITQTPYYVGQNLVTTVFVSSAASIAAMPSGSNQGGNGLAVNTIIGPNTDTTKLSRTTLYDPSTGQWSLVREAYKNHDYIPKIRFTSDENYSAAYMFVHAEKVLNSGDLVLFSLSDGTYTALSPSTLKCKMVRMGSVVRCYVMFTLTSTDVANAGQFVIGLRRYSVYDPSRGASVDFAGSFPLLSVYRGAFASDSIVPKTVENGGAVTVNNVSYHMMKMFSSYNGNTAFAVSGMSTANSQSWVIEYESFSGIDSITLV